MIYDKLLEIKKIRLNGVTFRIRRVTPADFLGKEGLPLSDWQLEAEKISKNDVNIDDLKKLWKTLFDKALVSVGGKDPTNLIDTIISNYYLSSNLYNEIVSHSLGLKKKLISRLFQRIMRFR